MLVITTTTVQIKGIRIRKEEQNSLFTGDMIM